MKITHTDTDSLIIYRTDERIDSIDPAFRYTVCQADVLDCQYEDALKSRGFQFHDRILFMEISLRGKEALPAPDSKLGLRLVCDQDFGLDVYNLAYAVYTTDRRFHLESVFNQEQAIPFMKAYIDDCKARNMKIFKLYHDAELLGYTIVDEQADPRGLYFENMLGVTAPGIKGKLAAPTLYSYMLSAESQTFKKYVGRVSASNAASMNLHYQLGAKTASIYDEFIFRTK